MIPDDHYKGRKTKINGYNWTLSSMYNITALERYTRQYFTLRMVESGRRMSTGLTLLLHANDVHILTVCCPPSSVSPPSWPSFPFSRLVMLQKSTLSLSTMATNLPLVNRRESFNVLTQNQIIISTKLQVNTTLLQSNAANWEDGFPNPILAPPSSFATPPAGFHR